MSQQPKAEYVFAIKLAFLLMATVSAAGLAGAIGWFLSNPFPDPPPLMMAMGSMSVCLFLFSWIGYLAARKIAQICSRQAN